MTSYAALNRSGELNGYPGLYHLREQVAAMVPRRMDTYVEPFAGLGRIAEVLR